MKPIGDSRDKSRPEEPSNLRVLIVDLGVGSATAYDFFLSIVKLTVCLDELIEEVIGLLRIACLMERCAYI